MAETKNIGEKQKRLARFEVLIGSRPKKVDTINFPYVRKNTSIWNVLAILHDNGASNIKDLRRTSCIKRTLYNLTILRGCKKYGLLRRDGYMVSLTQMGRWCGIAASLNVSLSELCVIADIYVARSAVESINMDVYIKNHGIRVRLGMSKSRMGQIYNCFVRKGYIRCKFGIKKIYVPAAIYMDDRLFESLHRFMEDMVQIQGSKWRFSRGGLMCCRQREEGNGNAKAPKPAPLKTGGAAAKSERHDTRDHSGESMGEAAGDGLTRR